MDTPLPTKACYRFRLSDGSPGLSVAPVGSVGNPMVPRSKDSTHVRVAVLPRPGWSSGIVTFVLRLRLRSVNSWAIKVVFRKFIQHETSTMTAASAKSKD